MTQPDVTVARGSLEEQTDCDEAVRLSRPLAKSIREAVLAADARDVVRLALELPERKLAGEPIDQAVRVAVRTALDLRPRLKKIREIRFVVGSGELLRLVANAFYIFRAVD